MTETEVIASVVDRDNEIDLLARIADHAHRYAKRTKANNTRRAYRADSADFTAW